MGCSYLLVLFLCYGWVQGQVVPTVVVPTDPDACPPGMEFQECGTACPATCNERGIRPCTLQCVIGCFCSSGTVLRSTNSSVCVRPENCPPTPSPDLCLPVLAISVPIKVVARGMNFCPLQERRNNNFTRFLTAQIVRRYRANATECRLERVQRTNCAVHGRRQRLRSTFTYTANLTCGDPCLRVRESDRGSLMQHTRNQDELREVYKERLSVDVRYTSGERVSILYFQGRKGSRTVSQECSRGSRSTTSIRERLDVCTCPNTCPNVCELPRVVGPCRAAIPRYFYNSTSSRCERFTYGGCQGNDNNFETLQECRQRCAPTTPPTPPTSQPTPTVSSCPGDKVYTTCGSACPTMCGNLRNPVSCIQLCVPGCFCPSGTVELGNQCVAEEACPSVCTLPPRTGPCRAAIPRYFYNSTSEQCENFTYGGCLGNDNNFETQGSCVEQCITPPTPPTSQPTPTVPSCPGDKVYTTCGSACPATCGNLRNPVACIALCVPGCFCPSGMVQLGNQCVAEEACPSVCTLPPRTGPCRAAFRRFFYNSTSEQCENFIYGGCLGNDNNFETQESCTEECISTGTTVPLPTTAVTPSNITCPGNRVFSTCGSPCPPTCNNREPDCITVCQRGCFCPEGTIEVGRPFSQPNRCVVPAQCPSIEPRPRSR